MRASFAEDQQEYKINNTQKDTYGETWYQMPKTCAEQAKTNSTGLYTFLLYTADLWAPSQSSLHQIQSSPVRQC